ncbi:metal-dependent hydrolase [Paenibacillus herberti]|uniref:Hydrolase n=1 Tax=Paenibacillus herberti TaxID=1619309 RepID=A0A229NTC1_9BACL|nr:metal-dependent hydrolase [Paenibacillus herberti]OXM13098.1 hydrolase [Paenibacillus herberti]
MDTGTHLVFGLGLAGLATVDPAVAASPALFGAVMTGTIIGSQAPDLDSFLRLKSNALYIKNHRGASHSLPAVLGWTAIITAAIAWAWQGNIAWTNLVFWVLLAVSVHVFSDCFNTYGTQAARPISPKWISWNIIHIFDPFLFISHTAALLLWAFGAAAPQIIFPILYLFIVLYYVWRTLEHKRVARSLPTLDPLASEGESYILIPTLRPNSWNIVKQLQDGAFRIGDLRKGKLTWNGFARCQEHPAIEQSKFDASVKAFLYFTSFSCSEVTEHSWGYEVRWFDVRYRYRKQYPFVAVVVMDLDYKTLGSYVGWLSDERLQKRLRMNTY